MGIEREAKYQVLDQALFRRLNAMDHIGGFALDHAGVLEMLTIYLDTPELELFEGQYAMRLRIVEGHALLSLKGPAISEGATLVRPEEEAAATAFSEKHLPSSDEIIRLLPAAAPVLRGLSLVPVLRAADRRALHYVLQEGNRACEIACDTVAFSSPRAPGRRSTEMELEIEQKSGTGDVFREVLHVFELFFALTPRRSTSKYRDGLSSLGLLAP